MDIQSLSKSVQQVLDDPLLLQRLVQQIYQLLQEETMNDGDRTGIYGRRY
ncbi:hypothetical protein [Thermocoleostomius sinensis]|uniref:Uncharacterized protein n=1 Tax=Thermocoleostomius sinensis A174 TaxID=2016057 RepID=A0A9E9C898_9CYAN|nr:hypothetical protein [Thermocoleostomius sinensis]WAL60093.1 hypothetical protein OXH18_23460 [Thermocoleostomius sinensis A174]